MILRVADNCRCEYERRHHERLGRIAGLSAEEVQRVRQGPDADGWSPRRRLLLRAADELHAERTISAGLWSELRRELSERELIELCMLTGHYEMLAMTLNALAVAPDQLAVDPPAALRARAAAPRAPAIRREREPMRRVGRTLAGRRVLITGAARGIGALTARRLHDRGARVALLGLEPEQLQDVAAACGDAPWFECDVADRGQVDAAVAGAVARLGGLDVAIANAGIGAQMTLIDGDPAIWDATLAVNLGGTYNLVRAAGPHVAHPGGYFLLTASLAAAIHLPLMSAYCASKAAVESLGDSLRVELGPTGRARRRRLLRRARHRHDLPRVRDRGGRAHPARRQRACSRSRPSSPRSTRWSAESAAAPAGSFPPRWVAAVLPFREARAARRRAPGPQGPRQDARDRARRARVADHPAASADTQSRQHDFGGLRRRDVGVQRPQHADRDDAADRAARRRRPGTEAGAIPAKVSENIRPTLIAGLAKLVELVKKYAAPM